MLSARFTCGARQTKQPQSLLPLAALLLSLSVPLQAQSPNGSWNLINTSDTQSFSADCTGNANQTDTPEDPPCQSYNGDLYETLDTGSQGTCDADIAFYRVGYDQHFFYFEIELRGSWDRCSDTNGGELRQYLFEIDADPATVGNFDWLFIYSPKRTHCRLDGDTSKRCDARWIDAGASGSGDVAAYSDNNDDYGSPNVTTPDYPSFGNGFETSFTLTNAAYVRILTRGGKNILQMAVLRSALGNPQVVSSRMWATQNSSLGQSDIPQHDRFGGTQSALANKDIDNSNGIDSTHWPESGPSAVPVTLASFKAIRKGSSTQFDWSTATETSNVGFHLYAQTADGLVRINAQLIPSASSDWLSPQNYRYTAFQVQAARFFLSDVDLLGRERRHGPFLLGESYGGPVMAEPIDWPAIRAHHEGLAAERRRESARRAPALAAKGEAPDSGRDETRPAATNRFPVYEFRLDTDGIYRVTYEQLRSAGLDLAGVAVDQIALINEGAPVPIRVVGSAGGWAHRRNRVSTRATRFGPGGFIEFCGEGLATLYTRTNVYELRLDARLARRVEVASATLSPDEEPPSFYLETLETENDRAYSFASPNGDPWYDTSILAFQSPVTESFPLVVENLALTDLGSSLEVDLWGVTDWPQTPDHHVKVGVNGVEVADRLFDGLVDAPVSVTLPPGLLQEGVNTLTLTLPADTGVNWDVVNLNGFSVTYPRRFVARNGTLAFEATGKTLQVEDLPSGQVEIYRLIADRIAWISGIKKTKTPAGRYIASFQGLEEPARYLISTVGSLLEPVITPAQPYTDITSDRADYLIVSHPAFLDELEPLVEARQAQDLNVKLVDVEDIYAQFGHGIFDPEAIRDYIHFAAANLEIQYVLLVGGDTFDYFDHLGLGSMSFIPSLYARTHSLVAFTPSDPLLTDLDGDKVPDLPIGRLPVRTLAELRSMIAKTLSYPEPSYRRKAVFAADRDEPVVSFTAVSEEFIEKLPAGWIVDRAYIKSAGPGVARLDLIEAINEGRVLTNYFGHSGPTRWSFENLFSATDAEALTNAGKPTLVIQWGCWNTYHVSPSYDTLSHKLLLSDDRGAALVLGAATLTEAISEQQLGALVFERLFEPRLTIGQAVQTAKQELALTKPELLDVILGWTLLGDPALVIEP